jgi:AcrR family transcriptional regulator
MQNTSRKNSPRRVNAEETRSRLIKAGRKAFAAKGLGGTNLRDDILVPAKVSGGSFYHQFSDKVELLLEILDLDAEGMKAEVDGDGDSESDETELAPVVRSILSQYFDMADRNPHFIKIYVREYYSDDRRVLNKIRKHNENTTQIVSRALESQNASGGHKIDTRLGGTLIGSLAISVINYYMGLTAKRRTVERESLITGTVDLLLGGISAVRGDG